MLPGKFLRWQKKKASFLWTFLLCIQTDFWSDFFSFLFNILQFPYYWRPETAASVWDCVCPFSCFWLSVWTAAQLLRLLSFLLLHWFWNHSICHRDRQEKRWQHFPFLPQFTSVSRKFLKRNFWSLFPPGSYFCVHGGNEQELGS